jgi:hypothetical protein
VTSLTVYLQAHPFVMLAVYYVFSAAISSMPAPSANSGNTYQWLYKFGNTLAGNLFRAFGTKLPIIPEAK